MWRQWNAYPDKLVKVVSTTAGDTLFSRLSTALTITIIYNVTCATVSCDHSRNIPTCHCNNTHIGVDQ